MCEDILIHVDNVVGNNGNDGTLRKPVATAEEAFSRLPCCWHGRAEIIFAATGRDYPITTSAVYFGSPIGPDASSLVIRGGYDNLFAIRATGDNVFTPTDIPEDELIGAVLTRLTGAGSPVGTAVSIRGNMRGVNSPIALQRTMGPIAAGDAFEVQRPAVTLVPTETLSLTSHDARSPNCKLIGIKIAPAPGAGLNLINLRAQCDTCELSFRRAFTADAVTCFVHTNSRIQGGIDEDLQRAQAGVYINSDDALNVIWAVRGGILGGHLTFNKITVRASQGGVFVPKSLEALWARIRVMAGGMALAEVGGWGTASNKARIRNVASMPVDPGDGLRVSNGGLMGSPLSPIHLDIFGCERDGIHLDSGSLASFGQPGGEAGLVTTGPKNGRFGMNIRNGSRALIGTDAARATVPTATGPMPLTGNAGQVALDGGVAADAILWTAVDANHPPPDGRLSLVRPHT